MYGAAPQAMQPQQLLLPGSKPVPLRRRVNFPALAGNVLLPWALFVGPLYLMSFDLHPQHTGLCWFLLVCGVLVPIAFAIRALFALRGGSGEPTSHLFLAGTGLLAWVLGVMLGNMNYAANMSGYYTRMGLSFPKDVDPKDIPGQHFLDAGGMYFKEGSYVAQDLSLGFKDGSTYCVAPIVSGEKGNPPASYDFWAVGVDCCNPMPPAAFWCGGNVLNPVAHAGLRLMEDGQKSFYRLGIEQAMAEYHYMARNPLLFTWTIDPVAEVEKLSVAGWRFFWTAVIVQPLLQTVFVAGMVFVHASKLSKH